MKILAVIFAFVTSVLLGAYGVLTYYAHVGNPGSMAS